MRDVLLFCLALIATPVSAASLDGRWFFAEAGVASCAATYKADDKALSISGGKWQYAKTFCDAEQTGGNVDFTCYGEGEKWTTKAAVILSGDTLTVIEDGTTTAYTRCPAQ